MLRLRRTLAFSSRVHNYLLLLFAFSLAVFFMQLMWNVTEDFAEIMTFVTTVLASIGIGYAGVMIIMTIWLWIADREFPVRTFFGILARTLLFVTGDVLAKLFTTVTSEGLVIHL